MGDIQLYTEEQVNQKMIDFAQWCRTHDKNLLIEQLFSEYKQTKIQLKNIIKTINSIQKVKNWLISDEKLMVFFCEELLIYSLEIIKYNLSEINPEIDLHENNMSISIKYKKMKWNPSDGPESAEELNEETN